MAAGGARPTARGTGLEVAQDGGLRSSIVCSAPSVNPAAAAGAICSRAPKSTSSPGAVVADGEQLWWLAKLGQIRTLVDAGAYEHAAIGLRSIERRQPDFDGGRFGCRDRFLTLKDELAKKVPNGSK